MTSPDSSANGSQGSEPLNYGPCVANPPKFSSVTPWDGMPIAEVLAIVDTMDSGRATGDAEAVRAALAMVGKVSSSLGSTFGESSLVGQGPDASVSAAGRLAAKIASSTEQVAGTVADLNAAQSAIQGARGSAWQLEGLQGYLRRNPESAPRVRAVVMELMTAVYSSPMIGISGPPTPAASAKSSRASSVSGLSAATRPSGGGADAAGGGTSTGGDSRAQSGAIADIDESARSGAPGGPGPGPGETPSGTAPQAVPAAVAGAVPPGGGPGPSGAGGGAMDGLLRGGRGSAVDGSGRDIADGRSGADGIGMRASGSGTPDGFGGGGGAGVTGDGDGPAGGGSAEMGPGGAVGGMPLAPPVPPGTGPTATPATPSAGPSGASGPAPNNPMRPAPAAPPPMAGRHRSDDEKHRPAAYLHTREHGTEIVGDLPLVGPPVIGDWAPAAPRPTGSVPAGTPVPASPSEAPTAPAAGGQGSGSTAPVDAPRDDEPGGAQGGSTEPDGADHDGVGDGGVDADGAPSGGDPEFEASGGDADRNDVERPVGDPRR